MKLRWLIKDDGSKILQYLTEYDYLDELPAKTQDEYDAEELAEVNRQERENKEITERLKGKTYKVR